MLKPQAIGGRGEACGLDPVDLGRQGPERGRLRAGEAFEGLFIGQAGRKIERGIAHGALADLRADGVDQPPASVRQGRRVRIDPLREGPHPFGAVGVDEEGEECSECDGDSEVECPECDNGYIECEECEGLGEFECAECEGEGIIEVESSISYPYYVYILTRMSQVKDIENYFMVENEIKRPYFSWNSITLDEIEDFNTPFKIYHLSEISLEFIGMNLLDSPFKRYSQNGPRTLESFIRRLKNYISDEHYT